MRKYSLKLVLILCVLTNLMKAQNSFIPFANLMENQSGTEKNYIAYDYIKLKPGFRYAASSSSFRAKIDDSLLKPPAATYKMPDGSFTSDPTQGAVVGSIPGSFAVSPSGAATYTIPIEVPAGINGMQPNISLTYNSQGGNGIAGWGWNISGLSMISRVPKNHYFDNDRTGIVWDNTSPLALDGQRLIEIQRWGTDSVLYDTEAKSGNRIVGINIKEWGAEYFKVYTKSGQIIQYGNPDNIASYYPIEGYFNPELHHNKFMNLGWAITLVKDANQNIVNYYYSNEESETIVNACIKRETTNYPHEGFRSECVEYADIHTMHYKNNLLERIEYGGNDFANKLNDIKVEFEYENISSGDVVPAYSDGKNLSINKILKQIAVYDNENLQKTYIPHYEFYNHKNQLTNLVLSNNQNEKTYSSTFDWNDDLYQYSIAGTATMNYNYSPLMNQIVQDGYNDHFQRLGSTWGDMDGDGDQDVIMKYRLRKDYYKSDWDKFWNNVSRKYRYLWIAYKNNAGTLSYFDNYEYDTENGNDNEFTQTNFWFIDKDMDGKEELYMGLISDVQDIQSYYFLPFYYQLDGLKTHYVYKPIRMPLNDYGTTNISIIPADFLGKGEPQFMGMVTDSHKRLKPVDFSDSDVFVNNTVTFPSDDDWSDVYISDFNGNGKSELVSVNTDLRIYELVKNHLYNGTLCNKLTLIYSHEGINSSDKLYTGDFNGDGNTDFLVNDYSSNAWRFLISTGTSLVEKSYTNGLTIHSDIKIQDVNKDGKSDIIVLEPIWINGVSSESNLRVFVSTGNNFELKLNQKYNGKIMRFYAEGHFNNDKYDDILMVSFDNIEVLNLSNSHQFNKISQISDSQGNFTAINYDLYNSDKIKSFHIGARGGDNNELVSIYATNQGSWDVVNTVKSYDADNNLLESNTYNYGEAIIHKMGKGLLGFKNNTITNDINSLQKISSRVLNAEFSFLLPNSEIVKVANSENIIHESSSKFDVLPILLTSKAYEIRKTEDKSKDYLTTLTTNTEYLSYDDYLNPLSIKTTKGDLVENQTISYIQKGAWCVNKPEIITSTTTYNGESTSQKKILGYDSKGNLTSETINPDDNKFKTVTEYTDFDDFGHPESIKVKAKDKNGVEHTRTSTQKYKANGRYIDYKVNLLGEKTTYDWDETKGLLKSQTVSDADTKWSKTTSYLYDNWGKIKETRYPDGIREISVLQWAGSGSPDGASYYSYSQTSGNAPVTVWYDGLGREIQKDSYGLNNNKISVKTEYYTTGTNIGKLYRVSEPYFTTETPKWAATYTVYDPYGRSATTVVTPTGTTTTAYSGLTTTITTPEGTKSTTLNTSGFVESTSTNGKKVNFDYYPNGLTKTSTPEGGTALAMEYNIQGKRTKLTDPDAGVIETVYNGFGELEEEKQLVHKNITTPIVTTNNYDYTTGLLNSINRNGEFTNYTYDSDLGYKARVKSIRIGTDKHVQEFTYDNYSRVTNVKESLKESNGTKVFNRGTEYDALGRVKKETYPSGYYTVNTYDSNSNLIGIKDKNNKQLWEAIAENARGQLTDAKKGGRLIEYRFDDRGLPTTIKSANIVDLEYNFDDDLNLEYRIEKHKTLSGIDVTHREDFKYDDLDRLYEWGITQTGATTAAKTSSIVYNPTTGTITSKSDLGAYTFGYGVDNTKPHALSSISGVPTNFPQPNSNFPLANLEVTYTDFKKIKTLSEMGKTYELTYGVDDQRRMSVYKESGATKLTRYYLGDYEEEIDALGNIKQIHYLSGAIMITTITPTRESENHLYYSYTDYQGSLIALTDESGTVVERYAYDPWGARRNPDNWTLAATPPSGGWGALIVNRGYTGHEHLDAFGIINMNGRVYDPLTAMFFSPDPYVQAPDNWLNYNRYGYCYGNPFKYTDPSGNLQIGPFYLSFNIGFSANGGFSFGISAGIGLENYASVGISINYGTSNNNFSVSANAGFGGGYAYAGFDTKGGFIAGTGYSVASLTSAFSPVTINTNMLSVGADYSSNGGFSGNYFGASISKAGLSFNPSVGASASLRYGAEIHEEHAEEGDGQNDSRFQYLDNEEMNNCIAEQLDVSEYGVQSISAYDQKVIEYKGGSYFRKDDGWLYKLSDAGGTPERIRGVNVIRYRGWSNQSDIYLSRNSNMKTFHTTLNHELIHAYHASINLHHSMRKKFNRYTEYVAYSYSVSAGTQDRGVLNKYTPFYYPIIMPPKLFKF